MEKTLKTMFWILLVVGIGPTLWSAVVAYSALSHGPLPTLPRYYPGSVEKRIPHRSFWDIVRGKRPSEEANSRYHDSYLVVTHPIRLYPRFWAVALVFLGALSLVVGFTFLAHFGSGPEY